MHDFITEIIESYIEDCDIETLVKELIVDEMEEYNAMDIIREIIREEYRDEIHEMMYEVLKEKIEEVIDD